MRSKHYERRRFRHMNPTTTHKETTHKHEQTFKKTITYTHVGKRDNLYGSLCESYV